MEYAVVAKFFKQLFPIATHEVHEYAWTKTNSFIWPYRYIIYYSISNSFVIEKIKLSFPAENPDNCV